MAALGKIRKHGVLLVTTIAVALFLFVAGDFVKGGQSLFQQSQQVVATIDGEDINYQDYQKLFEELQGFYEIVGRDISGEDGLNNVKDEAWRTLWQTTLIKKECDKLGLTVTNNEVADIIQNGQSQMLNVPFFQNQQTGMYDYSLVKSFIDEYQQLKSSGSQVPDVYEKVYKYYMFVQKQIRNQYLIQKYQDLLAKLLISNPVAAKSSFEERTSESSVVLASLPYTLIPDDQVEVSEQDIKAKYAEEKEKNPQIVETRDIQYIDVTVLPTDADREEAEKVMDDAQAQLANAATNVAAGNVCRQFTSSLLYTNTLKKKEAFPAMISTMLDSVAVGTTTKPQYDALTNTYYTFRVLDKKTEADSVLYRILGIGAGDDAEQKADSVLNALKNGASFAEIAKKYNQPSDSVWNATADYQFSTQIADDDILFINTLYSMQSGQVKKIVTSNGNNIIVQVLDKRNPVEKYNVASIVKTLNFSDNTYNNIYNKFNSFLAANTTSESIAANADKEGYSLLTYPDVMSTQHSIAGIHNTRDALKWVFDDAKPGDVSQLYECGDNNHMLVVILDQVNKKGNRSLSKMQNELTAQLRTEKKIEKLVEKAANVKTIEEAVAQGAVIDTINHLSFDSRSLIPGTVAYEPLVSAVAAKTAQGKVSAPIKGNSGVYLLQVLSKSKTAEQYDEKAEETQVSQQNLNAALNSFLQVLYLDAKVTDRRYKFF